MTLHLTYIRSELIVTAELLQCSVSVQLLDQTCGADVSKDVLSNVSIFVTVLTLLVAAPNGESFFKHLSQYAPHTPNHSPVVYNLLTALYLCSLCYTIFLRFFDKRLRYSWN